MEFSTYFRFVVALIFVLALIALIGWGARRFGFSRGTVRARPGTRRLDVIEIAPIDSKRRLVLVKRDGTEHLLLLGVTQDLVVETGITPPADPAPSPNLAAAAR